MNKKEKSSIAKIDKYLSWALISMGLVIFLSSFFKVSNGLLLAFSAMAFLLAGILLHFLIKANQNSNSAEDNCPSSSGKDIWSSFFSPPNIESQTDLSMKLQFSYLFELINPLSPLNLQIELICKTLSEIMPDKIFCVFESSHRSFTFITGARLNGFGIGQCIKKEDTLISQISERLLSLISSENLKPKAIWTEAIKFFDKKSGKEGLIIPGNLFGKTCLVMVCIESSGNETTLSQANLLRHAAVGMAILFDNHRLIVNKNNSSCQNQESAIGQALLKKSIQDHPPAIDGWQLSRICRNINGSGKDFSLYASISSDQTLIVTGNSSGKGLEAAMFFVKLKIIIECLVDSCKSPAEILNKLSIQLSNDTENELFASLVAIQIKKGERKVMTAVAGQNIPFIYRQKSGFVEIPSLECGVPVGLFNQGIEPYQNQTIHLLPGDGILLYTEGIFDLTDAGGQAIKSEELKIMLENISEVSAEKILKTLSQQLQTADINGQAEEECTLLYAKTE